MPPTNTIEAAVDSLLAPAKDEPKAEVTVEDEPEEQIEADDQDAAENSEDEGEEPELTDDEDEDHEETDVPETPSLYDVKVNGKVEQHTLEELKQGFAGQAYIQRGMQENAAARKEIESIFQTLQTERQQFLATVENTQQQGVMKAPQAPDIRLMDTDPIGYMQQKANYDYNLQEYQSQQRQLYEQDQRHKALQEQARQAERQQQSRRLIEAIPEFGDPEKAPVLQNKLLQFASKYGLSAEEVASTVDARLVQVLYDAYKYNRLSAVKDKAKKPEPPRNVKPVARKPAPEKIVRDRQMKVAKKSGKPEAFIDLLFR